MAQVPGYWQTCAAVTVAALEGIICARASADVSFDLGQVVGGGNGLGVQLPGNEGRDGLSTETGQFVTGSNFGHTYYTGYNLVGSSPFVDGTFNLGGTQITSTGVTYALLPGDASGASFDYIANNRTVGADPPVVLYGVPYSMAIGIHGGSGITFDLGAFRAISGTTTLRFKAEFGTSSGGDWRARGYVVVSTDTQVIAHYVSPIMISSQSPFHYLVTIPEHARFLTLMVGCGGDFITDDHAAFAGATLEAVSCPADVFLDGTVDAVDLALILSQWDTTGGSPSADVNGDGMVEGKDVAMAISAWGACPGDP